MDDHPVKKLRDSHVTVMDPSALFVVKEQASDGIDRREGIRHSEGLALLPFGRNKAVGDITTILGFFFLCFDQKPCNSWDEGSFQLCSEVYWADQG